MDEIEKENKMGLVERIDDGAISRLVLNQPSRLNVLSDDLLNTLQEELISIKKSKNIRCLIISGAGNGFCAGHDLKEMTNKTNFQKVIEFNDGFGVPVSDSIQTNIFKENPNLVRLRLELISEEFKELIDAMNIGDEV